MKNDILINANKSLNNKDFLKASALYSKVLSDNPRSLEGLFGMGIVNLRLNKIIPAKDFFMKFLEIDKSQGDVYKNLGIISQRLNKTNEAIDFYKKSINLKSNLVSLINLSSIFWSRKENLKAISLLEANDDLNNNIILSRLSRWNLESGFFLKSLKYSCKVILLKQYNDDFYYAEDIFCVSLQHLKEELFLDNNSDVLEALNILLDQDKDLLSLRKGFFKFIFYDAQTKNIIWSDRVIEIALASDPSILSDKAFIKYFTSEIVIKFLKNDVVTSVYLESIFMKSREYFLQLAVDIDESVKDYSKYFPQDNIHEFLCALSIQCDFNGYLWDISKSELENITIIKEKILDQIKNNKLPDEYILTVYSCYSNLGNEKVISDFILANKDHYSNYFQLVVKIHILDSIELIKNSEYIKKVGSVDNKTSLSVQNLYEDYPYPRWRGDLNVPSENNLYYQYEDKTLNAIFKNRDHLDILIAGCGTGKEACSMAKGFPNSKITAIDLSLSSLAYAKKKIDQLNIKNIELIQLDILNLGTLNKKFDLINSNGVIHHMDNPDLGLRILSSKLKKNGILNLGLYSKISRQVISAAKEEIKKLNIKGDDKNSVRALRRSIINQEKEFQELYSLIRIRDFYSFFEIQDALFHPREVLYELNDVKSMLESSGLEFIEFDNRYSKEKILYKSMYPDDKKLNCIDNWIEFEEKYPQTFLAMYLFYAKKIVN
tara:strand:+ start:1218 stop:3365 length:2148 start_codon:yes stop_codon:yes gene_type:complete